MSKESNNIEEELFKKYAQDIHEKEAASFVKIEDGWYSEDTLTTKDTNGETEECTIFYKEMVYWIIKKYNLTIKQP